MRMKDGAHQILLSSQASLASPKERIMPESWWDANKIRNARRTNLVIEEESAVLPNSCSIPGIPDVCSWKGPMK